MSWWQSQNWSWGLLAYSALSFLHSIECAYFWKLLGQLSFSTYSPFALWPSSAFRTCVINPPMWSSFFRGIGWWEHSTAHIWRSKEYFPEAKLSFYLFFFPPEIFLKRYIKFYKHFHFTASKTGLYGWGLWGGLCPFCSPFRLPVGSRTHLLTLLISPCYN